MSEMITPRKFLMEMAQAEEEKLQRDDDTKPPWRNEPLSAHRDGIDDEIVEMDEAAMNYIEDPTEENRQKLLLECIDVSLRAKLFYDTVTGNFQHDGRGRGVGWDELNGQEPGQRIVCAAIRNIKTGEVTCGPRHHHCLHGLRGYPRESKGRDHEQGFVDNFNNFLTREEAWVVAERQGQIVHHVGSDRKELFSENLY